jgi:hypothetical protein
MEMCHLECLVDSGPRLAVYVEGMAIVLLGFAPLISCLGPETVAESVVSVEVLHECMLILVVQKIDAKCF